MPIENFMMDKAIHVAQRSRQQSCVHWERIGQEDGHLERTGARRGIWEMLRSGHVRQTLVNDALFGSKSIGRFGADRNPIEPILFNWALTANLIIEPFRQAHSGTASQDLRVPHGASLTTPQRTVVQNLWYMTENLRRIQ